MRRRLYTIALSLAGMLSMHAAPALAQLCAPTANPCVVSASINVPSGSVFDLAGRDLVIAVNRVLTVQGAGIMFLSAGNITLDDGARIVANGTNGIGGDLTLVSSGAVVLDPSSRIDVSGGAGGSVLIMAGSVTMNGQIRANATLRDSEGGLVSIQTTGNVNVAGTGILGASGNRFGCGGFMEIVADGSVTASAPIDFRGGDCDGGDIDIDALGGITIGANAELSVIATYEFGSGGSVSLTAGGNVVLSGPINGNGEGSFTEGGGDGADLDIIGADVTMGGLVTLNGGAPDGGGGFVDVTAAGELRVNAPIQVTSGLQGIGGDLLLAADELIQINVPVTATAGFAGGSLDATSLGAVTLNAAATVDVSSTGGPFGQYGGTIDVQACNITIPLGADLLATGNGPTPRATIHLAGSGTTTIGGTINAGALTEIRYRSIPPVFQPGFTVSPAPAIVADGSLPCCVACGVTTTSTSSSTSTSITTSTIGGPTTSVVVTTTSTSSSSTTIPVPCGLPMTGCRTPVVPFKAKLVVKDKATDSGDKIVWKWLRGQATTAGDFGNPLGADGYQLCMWNVSGPPALIARVDAPAGGTCEGKPCWRATGQATPTGFKYVDGDLTPNGTQKVILASGVAGKAKAVVKAKGDPLTLPSLPLALPVLVQLQGGPGRCFEAYFATAGVGRNTIEGFEGRASVPNTTTTTSSSTTSTTSPVPICGNGAREFPEQCDDGNLVGGDCCSSTCMGEPVGQPCAEDGNVCTLDVCSGLGLCVHSPGNGGVTCRPASAQCDAAEQCSGVSTSCPADGPLPNGTTCDVSACQTGETCTAGVCGGGAPLECPACESCEPSSGCVPAPAAVCRHTIEPERSQLLIKDRLPDETDKIVWKWSKGEQTAATDFGAPNVDDDYALCLYDETTVETTLATGLSAPAAGACGGGACWRATSSGYKYVDPDLTPNGIRRMVLKAGGNGSSTITFKAKGVGIPMPALPLGSVLRVQLRGNDECWEATYSPGGIKQNDVAGFQARSD